MRVVLQRISRIFGIFQRDELATTCMGLVLAML